MNEESKNIKRRKKVDREKIEKIVRVKKKEEDVWPTLLLLMNRFI